MIVSTVGHSASDFLIVFSYLQNSHHQSTYTYTCKISSLFKIILVPLMLSQNACPPAAFFLKITDRCFQYAIMSRLISGINFLFHFMNQCHLFILTSAHLSLLHFLHPSLLTVSL